MKMDDIKKRIRFMKGVMDFSYPGFVLTKIRTIDKQLKKKMNLNINYMNIIHQLTLEIIIKIKEILIEKKVFL